MKQHERHPRPDERPRALGWIDHDVSTTPDADRVAVARLADRLGYRLVWPDEISVLQVADQVRNAGADTVLMPSPDHLGPLGMNRVLEISDVETVSPRLSFARWTMIGASQRGCSC